MITGLRTSFRLFFRKSDEVYHVTNVYFFMAVFVI